ncbi:glucose-6-phosphate isomerase [Sporichthya brevicatena]|uniref:Glucose-6-phosphate isomerase n=1 Tax=Sporichthya brevicatena TaxID=171442 RepID=A0ABN1GZH0_9ACTN
MTTSDKAPNPFNTYAQEGGGCRVRLSGEEVRAPAGFALRAASVHEVVQRLAAKDATLWGDAATEEAAIRLGWLDLPTSSRELLPRIAEVRAGLQADGLDHVVLAGMGGSSLAPEVICRNAGVELTVLDTTDANQIRRTLADRLDRTVVVVASKSGGTIETDSHRRAYIQAFRDAGLSDEQIAARFVVVTDPGSPLEEIATEGNYRALFLADPNVGGRYSALSAFGLVPSGLAGADVAKLLDEAAELRPALEQLGDNPGLLLGAALSGAATHSREKLVLANTDPALEGFGDWVEQLIAESSGKEGKGLLPVIVEGIDAPGWADIGPDAVRATLGDVDGSEIRITSGPLGAQFLLWEWATAFMGWGLHTSPFDQPNVTESKDNTARLLESATDGVLDVPAPLFTDGPIEVHGDQALLGEAKSLVDALELILRQVQPTGYLALMAYLDRFADADIARLRPALARLLAGPQVTFGWGPRFLHSTGQFHKGGQPVGVFLQITGAVEEDLPIPGRPYSFATLQMAQALGDLGALQSRNRPALRLHLTDRKAGIATLLAAFGA